MFDVHNWTSLQGIQSSHDEHITLSFDELHLGQSYGIRPDWGSGCENSSFASRSITSRVNLEDPSFVPRDLMKPVENPNISRVFNPT